MGLISKSSYSDGQVPTAAGFNAPLDTIYNEFNGNIDSNNIKAGGVVAANLASSINPVTLRQENFVNYVKNGLTIATSGTLSTSIISGVAYVNGQRLTPSTTPHTYTASSDTYVDLKDDGTFAYVVVGNNATAGMTLTTNSDGSDALRIAKVVTSGTAVTQVLQNGIAIAAVSPNTSVWYGFDPIGNQVYNLSPVLTHLGYVEQPALQSTASTSYVGVSGLGLPVRVRPYQRVRLHFYADALVNSGTNNNFVAIYDITSNTIASGSATVITQYENFTSTATGASSGVSLTRTITPNLTGSTVLKQYAIAIHPSAGTLTLSANGSYPMVFEAEAK